MIFIYCTSFSRNSDLCATRPIIVSPPLKGEPKKITQDHKEGQRENHELQAKKKTIMRNNQKTAPMQTMKPLGSRREKKR